MSENSLPKPIRNKLKSRTSFPRNFLSVIGCCPAFSKTSPVLIDQTKAIAIRKIKLESRAGFVTGVSSKFKTSTFASTKKHFNSPSLCIK